MSFLKFNQFLIESEDDLDAKTSLNEDYAQQAATNQANLTNIASRMEKVQQNIAELTKQQSSYKEKAARTKDDIAKAVYDAKISTANAKKNAYAAYGKYLMAKQSYLQTKAKEIEARMKASDKRKT